MKNTILWALAALNVLLLVAFIGKYTAPNTANAQAARPSDYVMIPGEVPGGTGAVVYVIDQTNRVLGAMVYDDAQKRLDTMQPIDLGRVLQGGGANVDPRGAGNTGAVGGGYGKKK